MEEARKALEEMDEDEEEEDEDDYEVEEDEDDDGDEYEDETFGGLEGENGENDDKKAAEQEQKESEVEKYGKDSGHKWIGKTVSRFVLSGDDDELACSVLSAETDVYYKTSSAKIDNKRVMWDSEGKITHWLQRDGSGADLFRIVYEKAPRSSLGHMKTEKSRGEDVTAEIVESRCWMERQVMYNDEWYTALTRRRVGPVVLPAEKWEASWPPEKKSRSKGWSTSRHSNDEVKEQVEYISR